VSLRVATAPVTWGVWERTIDRDDLVPPDELLGAAESLGYRAIELGPPGYFGSDAASVEATLAPFALVGAFVPFRLSEPADFEELDRTVSILAGAGTNAVVLLADAGRPDGLAGTRLRGPAFERAAGILAEAAERCRAAGLDAAVHPESGSYIESPAEVEAFLERLDPALVGVCLDTGHVTVGGGDAAALAGDWADRISHLHLKDVDPAVLARARAGEVGLEDAWAQGLFCELGEGEVDLAGVLETVGNFPGWAVLEQDRIAVRRGDLEAVRAVEERNLAYVRRLAGG
jgi:inosose dehydratase